MTAIKDDKSTTASLRLRSVRVDDLFGRFLHELNFADPDRMLILTAPNGYGKTAVLRLIDHFFAGRFASIAQQKFSSMSLKFSNGLVVSVSHPQPLELFDPSPSTPEQSQILLFTNQDLNAGERWEYDPAVVEPSNQSTRLVDRYLDGVEQVGPQTWYDRFEDEVIGFNEILDRYGHQLPDSIKRRNIPDWLNDILSSVNCQLIETQRIVNINAREKRRSRSAPNEVYIVQQHARDLSRRIKEKLGESARESQKLDQTFPRRVLERVNSGDTGAPNGQSLRNAIAQLEKRRAELSEAGLLAENAAIAALPFQEIGEETGKILELYVEDTMKKLALFEDLYDRISTLKNILGNRFHFKSVTADAEEGLVVTSDGKDKNKIDLLGLSSGEQHELILMYELLFKAHKNSLLLIDEPEISLHVGWQKQFLGDVERIIKLNNFQAIVATHSPQIINDRWDLVCEPQTIAEPDLE